MRGWAGREGLAFRVEFQIGKVLFSSFFFFWAIIIPSLKLYFSFSLALAGDGKKQSRTELAKLR